MSRPWVISLAIAVGLALGANAPADRDVARGRAWWAFQTVARSDPPITTDQAGVRNPIDAFVQDARAEAGLAGSPEADRPTLIRRLTFDLTGLPPSPAEVDDFVRDDRPDAYERLVDRLLASPRFGERWARPWLDLVRYADSSGFELDTVRPNAWRYRDWVVESFNEDMPYDRFVRLQLAADELEPDEPRHRAALGVLRHGPSVGNQRNSRIKADELDDVVATTSAAFLGLTVACARCHDHKADPIPTEDYYRLVAVFAPARSADVPLATPDQVAAHRQRSSQIDARADRCRAEMLAIENRARDRLDAEAVAALPSAWRRALEIGDVSSLTRDEQDDLTRRLKIDPEDVIKALNPAERAARDGWQGKLARIEADRPPPLPEAPGVVESGPTFEPVHVQHRGDPESLGDEVQPGPPRAVAGRVVNFAEPPPDASSTSRRAALAAWITDPGNPLTARVEVNRIWQGHFGSGLVGTPSDFGAMGDPPTLPRLLDWLALEFVASGWSRKAIHRQIVTSATYRQQSRSRPKERDADPGAALLWRFPPRRLEAEAIRDAVLWCSGSLNDRQGGPGVFPPIDPTVVRDGELPRWPLDARSGPEVWRRSLYVFQMRSVPFPLLEVFDLPDSAQTCPKRNRTTLPTQALALWNNPFVVDQSRRFAQRVKREAGPDPLARLNLAYRLATGRPPGDLQRLAMCEFLESQEDQDDALTDVCHVLLNSNSFLYLD